MIRRLLAVALVCATLGGPVAAAICQATCASHEADARAGHGHHHSCPLSAPGAGLAMNSVPHGCEHPSDETIAMAQALRELAAPASVEVQASTFLPPIETVSLLVRPTSLEQSPPGLLALTRSLRV